MSCHLNSSPIRKTLGSADISSSSAVFKASLTVICADDNALINEVKTLSKRHNEYVQRSPVTVPSLQRNSSAASLSTTATDQSNLKSATENSPNETAPREEFYDGIRPSGGGSPSQDRKHLAPPVLKLEKLHLSHQKTPRRSTGNEGISSAATRAEIRGREDSTCAARENSGCRKPSSQLSPRAQTELLFRVSMKLSRRRSSLKSEGGGHERMVMGGDQAEVSTWRLMRADTYGSLIRGVSVFNLDTFFFPGGGTSGALEKKRDTERGGNGPPLAGDASLGRPGVSNDGENLYS
ncbi:hypothetical protein NL676_008310 [Syzygium grande]|nr:hypothetical protein NL676_008310 [Syzygium grande]